MAENAHDSWAKKKKLELESLGLLQINYYVLNLLFIIFVLYYILHKLLLLLRTH